MLTRWARWAVLAAATTLAVSDVPAASHAGAREVPPPAAVLGAAPCADRTLATSEQIAQYFKALADASDRVRLVDIGPTTEGRRQYLAVIGSASTLRRLEHFQGLARALALNRDASGAPLTEAAARRLASEGRAVIWLDFGLHSNEAAPTQAAPWLAWLLATGETAELRRIRDRSLIVLVPDMNPDGTTQLAGWYRTHQGRPWEMSPPTLAHRYAGHDNNRDWFLFSQQETRNIARQLYEVFLPQIVYDHHQTAPFPARIFIPPFDEPVNVHIPAPVLRGVSHFGEAIRARLLREGRQGAISGVGYDTWWNGGMRTAPYFHNMIGLLTETAHLSPTPATYDASTFPDTFANGHQTRRESPDYPLPYLGGRWTFRQSCEYILSASLAVLDAGAAEAERWQYGMYAMARDAMRDGADDTWIIPSGQWDPGAAAALVEALNIGGVRVGRADTAFTAGGRRYPEGSFLIAGAQPFLPVIRDLLTPQRYPDRRDGPTGQPLAPYDITGWTLSLQMGVDVRHVTGTVRVAQTAVEGRARPGGAVTGRGQDLFAIDPRANGAFTAANALLRAGATVARVPGGLDTGAGPMPPGAFIVRPSPSGPSLIGLTQDLGLSVAALDAPPPGTVLPYRTRRIGMYGAWGGNPDEGWTRWVLERHGFPVATLRDADIRAGHLRRAWDVILLPAATAHSMEHGVPDGQLPQAYTGGLGRTGVSALRAFVEAGGVLVALDEAGTLPVSAFGLPVTDVRAGLGARDLYIPGSLLDLAVDSGAPLGWGLPNHVAAFLLNSPAWRVGPLPNGRPGLRIAARHDSPAPVLSGWAVGAEQLRGSAAVLDIPVGEGHVVLLGLRTQHRGQTLGTFKLLFNAITSGGDAVPWLELR